MKAIHKYIIAIALVGATVATQAQDQPTFNDYIITQGIINPAVSGTRGAISGFATFRTQWTGFDGAPITAALNVHSPIGKHDNIGLGGVVIEDKVGFKNNLEMYFAGAYRVHLGELYHLSFGLQAGFKNLNYDSTESLYLDDYGDPVITGLNSKFGINFGFGAYFYSKKCFVGFSIPRFFNNSYDSDKDELKNTVDMSELSMYLYGGCIFGPKHSQRVKFKPTACIRSAPGAPMELDVNFNVLLMSKLWLGAGYRTVSDAIFLCQYHITDQWSVRYSFDYSFSDIHTAANAGSHEIGIQFDLAKIGENRRALRYY